LTYTSSLLSQQWQSCLSQKVSYEQTISSKFVNGSNRLQWCFVCGLNPASKLTKPVTANEDTNGLTTNVHNLNTAGNITFMATRRDLHKLWQKQQTQCQATIVCMQCTTWHSWWVMT
jgi:hypothetical protein